MAAIITIHGTPCLNVSHGSKSYLILDSDSPNTLSADTMVTSVLDSKDHNLKWVWEKSFPLMGGMRIRVRLRQDKGYRPFDNPPDAGTITVTVTNPPATPSGSADYVNDDGT